VAVMDVARSFSVSVKAASGRQWFPMIGRGVEILGVEASPAGQELHQIELGRSNMHLSNITFCDTRRGIEQDGPQPRSTERIRVLLDQLTGKIVRTIDRKATKAW
jgi:hypothetical protein